MTWGIRRVRFYASAYDRRGIRVAIGGGIGEGVRSVEADTWQDAGDLATTIAGDAATSGAHLVSVRIVDDGEAVGPFPRHERHNVAAMIGGGSVTEREYTATVDAILAARPASVASFSATVWNERRSDTRGLASIRERFEDARTGDADEAASAARILVRNYLDVEADEADAIVARWLASPVGWGVIPAR
jgi:hypothetical protein